MKKLFLILLLPLLSACASHTSKNMPLMPAPAEVKDGAIVVMGLLPSKHQVIHESILEWTGLGKRPGEHWTGPVAGRFCSPSLDAEWCSRFRPSYYVYGVKPGTYVLNRISIAQDGRVARTLYVERGRTFDATLGRVGGRAPAFTVKKGDVVYVGTFILDGGFPATVGEIIYDLPAARAHLQKKKKAVLNKLRVLKTVLYHDLKK